MCAKLERHGPLLLAALAAAWLFFFGGSVSAWAVNNSPKIRELYQLSFGFSVFFCGTLFGIYVFLLGPSATFVQKIFATKTFSIFARYVAAAIVSNFGLSVSSAFMTLRGTLSYSNLSGAVSATIWSFLVVLALLTTMRVVAVFLVIVKGQQRLARKQGRY